MSNPMPEKPLGLPTFDIETPTAAAPGTIKLGFGLEGPLPLSAEGISGYINGLAQTNPAKFANILKAVEATGIKVNDFTDVGTAIGRLVTNMKTDENSPIKSMTVETFLNSVNKSFKFGKVVQPKGPTEQFYFTSPEAAGAELDAEFTKVLGVSATDAEKSAFYKKIKKAQESKPSVTTTKAGKGGKPGKVVQTQGFSAEEKDALINEFVAVRAKGAIGTTQEAAPATVDASGQISYGKVKTKYDPLAGEKFGGEYSAALDSLRASSSKYGVQLTDEQIKQAAITAISNPGGVVAEQNKIKAIASRLYPALTDSIVKDGLTVQDILQPYINRKAQVLEIPANQISLNNAEGQQLASKVITEQGLLPIYNYEKELRADPRWRFTKNANDEAATWVNTILKDFGIAG
jgi:hypothetical protein